MASKLQDKMCSDHSIEKTFNIIFLTFFLIEIQSCKLYYNMRYTKKILTNLQY